MKAYLDNAATTAMSDVAINAMLPYLKEIYGNPSSIYEIGNEAKVHLDKAREDISAIFNAKKEEIYFTSCGTESDNWAVDIAVKNGARKGKNHIISSKIEHHAILHKLQSLEKQGYDVTYLDVYDDGLVRIEDVKSAMTDKTCLVTIMFANNEIGTIQPIKEIGALCREAKVVFHTDAVQAAGHVHIDVEEMNIDMLSISAHKFHGPKGVGALYIKKGIQVSSLLHGGAQEKKRRAGTENVAGIISMVAALKDAVDHLEENSKRMIALREKLIENLLKVPRSRINGDRVKRVPGTVNMCFQGVEGEALLLMLDMMGISGSSGSACTSGSLDPSHVLLAIGLPHEIAHGSLRLSLSEYTTEEEIDYVIEQVPKIVERLRDMSPVWERIMKEGN